MSDFDPTYLPSSGERLQDQGIVIAEINGARDGTPRVGATTSYAMGVVHGGVHTTGIASVASVGASAADFGQGQFAAGVNDSTDFLRSMRIGLVEIVAAPVIQGRVERL